jgi:hypothetical protein
VLAGRRETEEHRRRLAARVAADEQPVAAADANQFQRPLTEVVVDVQVAIRRVALQRLPLVEHIVDGRGDRTLGQHLVFLSQ